MSENGKTYRDLFKEISKKHNGQFCANNDIDLDQEISDEEYQDCLNELELYTAFMKQSMAAHAKNKKRISQYDNCQGTN